MSLPWRYRVGVGSLLGSLALGAVLAEGVQSGARWAPRETVNAPGVNGAVKLEGVLRRVKIGPATVTDAYRAVESMPGSAVDGLTIRGLTGRNLQRDGIRLRQASDVTISDFDLSMRPEPQSGRNLPEGIAIYAGHDITIRDGRLSGFRMVEVPKHYTNGDGIATESGVDGITIVRVRSTDNSDGGFDLKGTNIRLDALTAERNGRGFRFWGQATAGTLTSIDSRGAAFWFGRGAAVKIDRIVVRSSTTAPILLLDGAASVEIGACDLSVPPGTKLVRSDSSGTTLSLGASCKL